jgi:DNA-binding LytR/AlgR family response regulator
MIRVPIAEIDRIEAERGYMRLQVGARSHLRARLKALMRQAAAKG